ncbi:MAG: hypothetical protein GY835_03135 [bacterium]|nr:hypothetical protein [bacterium]
MPTPLKIRITLRLHNFILFKGFVPEESKSPLEFSLMGGRFCGRIYVADPEEHIADEADVTRDENPGVSAVMLEDNLPCLRLNLDLTDYSPPEDITTSLYSSELNETTGDYCVELAELVLGIEAQLIHSLRFLKEQFWLTPREYEIKDPQKFLDQRDAKWLNKDKAWQELSLREPIRRITLLRFTSGITEEEWVGLAPRMALSRSPPIWEILVANGLKHLAEDDIRLAFIESVAALELAVKTALPRHVFARLGDSGVSERSIEKLVERAGLRVTTEVVLGSMPEFQSTLKSIIKSIEIRNQIIHQGRRSVPRQEAEECVIAALNAVKAIMSENLGDSLGVDQEGSAAS